MKAAIFKFHHQVAWIAGVTALTWGLSGFGHPIMVWLSPRPVAFSAPTEKVDLANALAPGEIMRKAGIDEALEVRALTHGENNLYLIRQGEMSERRYFDVVSGAEMDGLDRARAESLARHYTGYWETPIKDATYLTAFSDDYPDINRLLPVWRVTFDRDDGRAVYVDTGTGQLATIDNKARAIMRFIFVNVHTLDFLPREAAWARVLIIFVMVGSLWFAAVLGVALLIALKARKRQETSRKWHRIIGYAALFPALMFTSSGLYHLLHGASSDMSASNAIQPMPIAAAELTLPPQAYVQDSAPISGMNAVRGAGGAPLLRFALLREGSGNGGGGEHAHHQDHMKRLENQPQTLALWYHAHTAASVDGGAEAVAQSLAQEHLGIARDDILSTTPVTRFSSEYGFLNKRLPVWRLALKGAGDRRIFVDAANGVIASKVNAADMRELWVFDNLHKWQFMGFLGRIPRDIISMIAVALVISMAAFGWILQLRRRR